MTDREREASGSTFTEKVVVPESTRDLRGRIEDALRSYRCDYWLYDDSGGGMQLVDVLSDDEGSIRTGDREIELLADHLAAELAEPTGEGEREPDHERRILAFFMEARDYYRDIYDWDDRQAAESFMSWVRETVEGFLDGKYDGGPHDPRRSDATARHEGGGDV